MSNSTQIWMGPVSQYGQPMPQKPREKTSVELAAIEQAAAAVQQRRQDVKDEIALIERHLAAIERAANSAADEVRVIIGVLPADPDPALWRARAEKVAALNAVVETLNHSTAALWVRRETAREHLKIIS
jgi:septal ring factor EnvC (AmiA/AmiB activator)